MQWNFHVEGTEPKRPGRGEGEAETTDITDGCECEGAAVYLVFHVGLALFCLQRLAHAKSNTAFVQSLISCQCHADLVSHA